MSRAIRHPRDERNNFLSGYRKQQREIFYNKIRVIIIDQGQGIDVKDRLWALRLIEHKLQEKKEHVP